MESLVSPKIRIEAIDLARGFAMGAMATFHFAWDLEFFGYAPPGMTRGTGWTLFARTIATSFLFLVGVSLFLAHLQDLRIHSFLKRLASVGSAAFVITVVTWIVVPQGFIFFGILHQIALASLLGLAFLRFPVPATIGVAAIMIAAPWYLRHEFFDHPALWWVGLSPVSPISYDYVPLFPWFGTVLLGIAGARVADRQGLFLRLSKYSHGSWSRPIRFVGRHGLTFYLLHQPVLIGTIWLFALAWPPPSDPSPTNFTDACATEIAPERDIENNKEMETVNEKNSPCNRFAGTYVDNDDRRHS